MTTNCFNEYGVLVDDDFKDHANKIYEQIRAFLIAEESKLTISDLMLLQRHYIGTIDAVFASKILERQIKKRKDNNPDS